MSGDRKKQQATLRERLQNTENPPRMKHKSCGS